MSKNMSTGYWATFRYVCMTTQQVRTERLRFDSAEERAHYLERKARHGGLFAVLSLTDPR